MTATTLTAPVCGTDRPLGQAAAATLIRCLAGRYGDRAGHQRLLIPAPAAASAGMMILAVTGSPVALLAGSLLFGSGFSVAASA